MSEDEMNEEVMRAITTPLDNAARVLGVLFLLVSF